MQINSTFVELPIVRGFSEISALWPITQKHNAMICGGYARYCLSQVPHPPVSGDVDLFPQSADSHTGLIAELKSIGFEIKHENEISVTFKKIEEHTDFRWMVCPIVQVIKPVIKGSIVTVGTMQEVLNNFDFTIVRAGLLSPTTGLADSEFLEHDKTFKLVFKNIHCPISSTFRTIKYCKKGYWMGLTECVKLFLDWNERGPDYQNKLLELIGKMKTPAGEGPSKKDIEELEALMNID